MTSEYRQPHEYPRPQEYSPPQVIDADFRVTETGEVVKGGDNRRRGGLIGTLLAALVFIGSKAGYILSALKGVKFLGTGATALLSVGSYALLFNWEFGVGLVLLLFIHEMGHVLALKRYGVRATAPIFIPFMGAFIGMKQLPKDATMEAVVGLGGPVVGSLGALGAWLLYSIYDHPLFLVMTYLGIFLNLFNLLPILPLDGGRIVGVLSRWFWLVGAAGLVGLMLIFPSPILLLILLFGAPELWARFKERNTQAHDDYYAVPLRERLAVGATYFGLVFLLGYAMFHLGPIVADSRPS
ncbi:MAG TPA: site-2 protease family protein [Thermomicrobiales bacterium]|nr:site-2 protease family protein [Thermomicrobiales bacterium]